MSESDGDSEGTSEAVLERLGAASHPLVTTDLGASTEDLRPLDGLGEATVVGVGEATHGGRAVMQAKGRLVRRLVAEHGHRVVAFETPFPATLAVDRYVARGEGDPREALAGMRWLCAVESVLELVEWLRSFNADRPPDDRVHVHGADVPYTAGPARAVQGYLDRVESEPPEVDALAVLADGLRKRTDDGLETALSATEGVPATVLDRLDERREAYVAATDERAWELARRSAWALERARRTVAMSHERPFGGAELRERSMAETVRWALDHEDADRGVYWAHTAHVGRGDWVWGEEPAAGQRLAERVDDYRPVCVGFGRGTVRAQDPDTATDRPVTWTVETVPEGSLPAALVSVTGDDDAGRLLAVERGTDRVLAEWVTSERPRRSVGSTAVAGGANTVTDVLADRFDAAVCVAETGPTALLKQWATGD